MVKKPPTIIGSIVIVIIIIITIDIVIFMTVVIRFCWVSGKRQTDRQLQKHRD